MAKAHFSTLSRPDTTADTSAEIIPFPVDRARRSARIRALAILADAIPDGSAISPAEALAEPLGAIRNVGATTPGA